MNPSPNPPALSRQHLEQKVANLERALVTARLIGIAVGVLMARLNCTREDAFELLRSTSQRTNRKLADLAAEVADCGGFVDAAPQPGNSYGQPSPH